MSNQSAPKKKFRVTCTKIIELPIDGDLLWNSHEDVMLEVVATAIDIVGHKYFDSMTVTTD